MAPFAFQSKYLDSCSQLHLPCVNAYQQYMNIPKSQKNIRDCFGPEETEASEKAKVFNRLW